MRGTDIAELQEGRGWTRSRLVHELRLVARRLDVGELPSDESLKRMIRQWISGSRGLSDFHADLLTAAFGVPFAAGRPSEEIADRAATYPTADELRARLDQVRAVVDSQLVDLLEAHTDGLRALDRRLGARKLLAQTKAHVGQVTDLLTYALPGGVRPALAAAAAEAAALAGWQALDLGRPDDAWLLHETAKTAARECEAPAVLAHVTAQQAYALLDVDKPADSLALIQHAREAADGEVPGVMHGWLWAALAESLAAVGEEGRCRRALDEAARLIAHSDGEQLPYLFLDPVHLARWRGHCLARLGCAEAVNDLASALADLDPSFTRAASGLHCDLALAYSQRGEHDAALAHAGEAAQLAAQTSSARQRRRISELLTSGGGSIVG